MRAKIATMIAAGLCAVALPTMAADLDYGKPGDPVQLTVGYQPYYSEAWSGVVINGLKLWQKYLPAGSTVEFRTGLQGSVVINEMLAGKENIGYVGDMPAIVGATKRSVADLRILAAIGASHDQCNVFFARNDAPQFTDQTQAIKWLDGKTVAVPKGSCTDRFGRAVFEKEHIQPSDYLNQSIEVITSGFRAGKLDGAVIWEPTASRLVIEGLARRVASGNGVDEDDGAFLEVRADLVKQRPDVIKGWLQAELDAELFLADPANTATVVRLAREQTTGFTDKELWQALYGTYPAAVGGAPVRLTLPFGFTDTSRQLIDKATTFLHTVQAIDVAKLADDAVLPQFTADVLKERSLTAPVATIKAQANPVGIE